MEAGKCRGGTDHPDQFKESRVDLGTQRTGISETAVMLDLINRGYDVFVQTTGKSSFDLVAHRNSTLFRVQVKSCWEPEENGSYRVMLRSVRVNATKNKTKKFDPNSCDILAIYLGGGTITYLDPKLVGIKNEVAVKTDKVHRFNINI